MVLSGLATGASGSAFPGSQDRPGRDVAPVDKLSVVLVALLGVIFLGDHLSLRAWLGVVLITSVVLLIALRPA